MRWGGTALAVTLLAAEPAIAEPAPLAAVTRPASTCSATQLESAAPLNLRLTPSGPIYAAVKDTDQVQLDLDPRGGAWVAVKWRGLQLRGFVAPREVTLGIRSAEAWGGLFEPDTGSRLKVVEISGSDIVLEVLAPPGLELQPGTHLRSKLPCSQVYLGVPSVPASADAHRTLDEAWLLPGKRIPLSSEPGGAMVAQLVPGTKGRLAYVVSKSGAERVELDDPELVSCVLGRFREVALPAADGRAMTVVIPITFGAGALTGRATGPGRGPKLEEDAPP